MPSVSVYLTSTEYANIAEIAQANGLTVEQFLQEMVRARQKRKA